MFPLPVLPDANDLLAGPGLIFLSSLGKEHGLGAEGLNW